MGGGDVMGENVFKFGGAELGRPGEVMLFLSGYAIGLYVVVRGAAAP